MDTSMSWTGPLQRNGENIEKSENRMGSVKWEKSDYTFIL
jgi:hypothetical protein